MEDANNKLEIWKDITSYEGKYKISNLGRVKSLKRKDSYGCGRFLKEKILKPRLVALGYLQVSLCHNGLIKQTLVHRLVGKAFIPNPENKPKINHIDGIKTNNFYKNLEWSTSSENQLHAYKTGLQKPTIWSKENRQKLSEIHKGNLNHMFDKTIYKFQNKITGEIFKGYRNDFIKKYNLDKGSVYNLINNKLKSTKKWILLEILNKPDTILIKH